MDGVVIDDRRIKVDFSQSVAKLIPKGRNNPTQQQRSGENKERVREIVRNGKASK
jgi:hypothetical protein